MKISTWVEVYSEDMAALAARLADAGGEVKLEVVERFLRAPGSAEDPLHVYADDMLEILTRAGQPSLSVTQLAVRGHDHAYDAARTAAGPDADSLGADAVAKLPTTLIQDYYFSLGRARAPRAASPVPAAASGDAPRLALATAELAAIEAKLGAGGFDVRRLYHGPLAEELFLRLSAMPIEAQHPGMDVITVKAKNGLVRVARIANTARDPVMTVPGYTYVATLLARSQDVAGGKLSLNLERAAFTALEKTSGKEPATVSDRDDTFGTFRRGKRESQHNEYSDRYSGKVVGYRDEQAVLEFLEPFVPDAEFAHLTPSEKGESQVYTVVPPEWNLSATRFSIHNLVEVAIDRLWLDVPLSKQTPPPAPQFFFIDNSVHIRRTTVINSVTHNTTNNTTNNTSAGGSGGTSVWSALLGPVVGLLGL